MSELRDVIVNAEFGWIMGDTGSRVEVIEEAVLAWLRSEGPLAQAVQIIRARRNSALSAHDLPAADALDNVLERFATAGLITEEDDE